MSQDPFEYKTDRLATSPTVLTEKEPLNGTSAQQRELGGDAEIDTSLYGAEPVASENPEPPSVGAPPASGSELGQGSAPLHSGTPPTTQSTPTAPSGWEVAHQSYAEGQTLDLNVVGYNRGGLLVDLGDIRGFVPASQLVAFPRRISEEERMNELAQYVGKSLRLKVIELDRAHSRLILSERIAKMPVSRSEQLLSSIQPGQCLTGTIRNVTDFGAFVDLGGIEGLIHVSEMSWQRVGHPRDVCVPGAQVKVYVIDINREQRRIGLSLKRLAPDPWALAAQHYKPGDIVAAVITNVVSFGAFARLPEGIEGLIHTSELAEGNFLHPHDVVHEGDTVRVRVLNVDPTRQRIGLTLRLTDTPRPPASAQLAGPPEVDDSYWNSLASSS